MASNKFFTIMIVPEKTQQVKKVVIPHYIFNGGILALSFLAVLAIIMVLDYANVMSQISENKHLKIENRQLRQSIQVFKNKMVTIENTMDRVKTFVTKLKIITNIEENNVGLASIPGDNSLPFSERTGEPAINGMPPMSVPPSTPQKLNPAAGTPTNGQQSNSKNGILEPDTDLEEGSQNYAQAHTDAPYDPDTARSKRRTLLAALMTPVAEASIATTLSDADTSLFVKKEFERLDAAYEEVNKYAVAQEQEAQNLLERLGEKRALLASTPTRIPTLGYITSDYGVRISPYDGRRKMHEGIDIANRWGADVFAPADGVIVFVGVKPGYGKMVVMDHGNGIETRYAHNSRFYVEKHQKVRRGQKIAAVGSTGHSTGPHVHYEVHAGGMPVDPCWYILDFPAACRPR